MLFPGDCSDSTCGDHGTCYEPLDAALLCICDAGCTLNIDDCLPNPCHNDGSCTDGINLFSCQCTEDFLGENCETSKDLSLQL